MKFFKLNHYLLLPPLAIIGIVAASIAWIKSHSMSAMFSIVLSVTAFIASIVVSAADMYFRWGWWR